MKKILKKGKKSERRVLTGLKKYDKMFFKDKKTQIFDKKDGANISGGSIMKDGLGKTVFY